jgi:hypothetical protein
MFRITKIFANSSLEIYRVEGKVTDDGLQIWTEELNAFYRSVDRHILLDFCRVWAMSARAMAILTTQLAGHICVMNPNIDLRNMLHAAGLAAKVLE